MRNRKRVVCQFKMSALYKTWFSKGHLSIYLLYNYDEYSTAELDILSSTAVDWINFSKNLFSDCCKTYEQINNHVYKRINI